jgi:hypothetical protein
MTESADAVAAARKRLSDIDTDTLKDMWSGDGRTEWAEGALRLELIERGVDAQELDAISIRRPEIAANAPPSVRGVLWNYGFVGRILTMAGVVLWLLIARAVHGSSTLKVSGVVAVLGIYVDALTRRTIAQSGHRVKFSASLLMYWQVIEAWLFLAGAIITAVFIFAG